MKAVAWRIRSGIARVKKCKQHAARFQHRPQTAHHWLHQTFIEIVGQIPAQHHVKVSRRVNQVVGKKFSAVKNCGSLLVLGQQFRIGGGREQIFAVDSVAVFSEVANVGR